MLPETRKFYIDGAWVAPEGDATLPVINPATEAEVAQLALGSSVDIDKAVAAAKSAFPTWAPVSKADKLAILRQILHVYTRRFDEFADVMTTEMGAPHDFSREQQAQTGIDHVEAFIDVFESFEPDEVLSNGDLLVHEPIGVCGLITPWNWPVNQIVLKVIPALAAGCTMVLKPSELTPFSAVLYAEVLHEAGVPPGVFNLVQGLGPEAGAAMSRHPDIDMMSFTGSHRGGSAVSADAAPTVKRVALELGGKSPNIIFADADLEAAVGGGVVGCFSNTGQSCDAPTRMLVEASAYPDALDIAKRVAESTRVGDPTKPGDHIGPLVSQLQYDRVQEKIEIGMSETRALVGGPGKPDGLNNGYYVRPTVFSDVTNDMRIAREEVFGPVLTLQPFETEEQAIELANDTTYGLGAYLSTSDPEKALRVARQLRSGTININGAYQAPGSPFGGYRQSGIGREGGMHGLLEFMEVKAIAGR